MNIYLRPIPLLPHDRTEQALRLAGGNLFFSHVEVITRSSSGARRPGKIMQIASLSKKFPTCKPQIEKTLHRLTRPRASIGNIKPEKTNYIMGIINLTPDSFSDGGLLSSPEAISQKIADMQQQGADILDFGAESTRPGSKPVTEEEEMRRLVPLWQALEKQRLSSIISIDTRRARVARLSSEKGALLWNDVSALRYDESAQATAADIGTWACLMHAQGTPETMQQNPLYTDAPLDIYDFFTRRIEEVTKAGIARDRIILDPGIGFGKKLEHNIDIMRDISLFHSLGCPLMVGASRKGFIGAISGEKDPRSRLPGSVAAAMQMFRSGVQIFRVHDVAATREALRICGAIANI